MADKNLWSSVLIETNIILKKWEISPDKVVSVGAGIITTFTYCIVA